MLRRGLLATGVLAVLTLIGTVMTEQASAQADPANTVYMDLAGGRVTIELLPNLAPKMVERFKTLIKEGFYDGTPFHRVIDGFMAQGGDPTGTGTGGSKLPNVPAEFSDQAHFLRGTLGAARTNDPDTANSQFFICFAPSSFLDGKYTIFGRVVQGMDLVDKIKRGAPGSGAVQNPDRIVRMQMASDAKS